MAISSDDQNGYSVRNRAIVAELFKAAGALPPVEPRMAIKRKAAELSSLMALVHGGDWRVQIDHEVGLIVVARQP